MAKAAEAMSQDFPAVINAQLISLPIFSENFKEDELTAKQWLEKVIIKNKTGGNWNDVKTLTHFRNAVRGDMVDWYHCSIQ